MQSDQTISSPSSSEDSTNPIQVETNPFKVQVGGDHYREFEIQPAEFLQKNKIPYMESNAVKYILRHKKKGGAQDLRKAIQYIEMLIVTDYGENP